MDIKPTYKSGYVAIVGKPNAGKSTLMNQILGSKLSIATHKPQTTRHQVIGIHSTDDVQIIFLDTPGLINPKYELQKAMMRFVEKAEKEADIILFIVDVKEGNIPDHAFEELGKFKKPILLIVNKIDTSEQREAVQLSSELNEKFPFSETVFVSALEGHGVEGLIDSITKLLPQSPPFYPDDILSEHPVRFFCFRIDS